MHLGKYMTRLAAVAALALLVTGCSDDDPSPLQQELSAAQQSMTEGDWNAAIQSLGELSQTHPDDPQVRQYRASAYAGRAGLTQEKVMDSFSQEDLDGTPVYFASVPTALALVNYHDPEEFKVRLMDGQKALSLMVPEGTDVAALPEEQRIEAGLAATTQSACLVVHMFGGQNPEEMTDEEIAAAVSANLDEVKEDLEQALTIAEATRSDLIGLTVSNPIEAVAVSAEVDSYLTNTGLAVDNLTVDDVTSALQYLNDGIAAVSPQ